MPEASRLWYKDAVIYQVHVRAFHDSSNDGIGDFRGLTEKLDYLQDLGATALWLLPFYPSPLRDDGYDIADYMSVHPSYGTLQDFRTFLREAHERGLKVITELVLNHTSDQHPWFQRARRSKRGSRYRDYYVWSDTPDKYRDARIIFKDFETSNWTWDPVAQAYYWHRFYSHQPDLNFDHAEVRKAMFHVLDHWLGMGVDGLRLDAVPYLFEREGTNCENLPETHAFLREIRQYVDTRYPGTMLLAEANQWPEDAVAYFGAADECQCAFHFPVMPRMFMAVQMEDRFPVIDIMQQTPEIPETCQWMIFLRNHDELTLEMVTDEERDYMYRVYAHDPKARINLGIRRRLAPLLGNHRRKIELLNSLLMSLPGTPVIYYGDEIGMGDNIYLGDRNGVRTPMQWSPDRNAGFSQANPQQLYLPLIIDHEYHYEAVNVETSRRNLYSLFWWMKRIIALRQQSPVFSRGALRFLHSTNAKVLAFLRTYQEESILVVANLSRFCQFVELDLGEFRGTTPVELFGRTPFPRIGELPYLLTLGPHGFYWFAVRKPGESASAVTTTSLARGASVAMPLRVARDWEHVFEDQAKRALEDCLARAIPTRRWFSGKAKVVRTATIADVIALPPGEDGQRISVLLVRMEYVDDEPEVYLLPLAFATGDAARQMIADSSSLMVATLQVVHEGSTEEGVLYDAFGSEQMSQAFLDIVAARRRLPGVSGKLVGHPARSFRPLRGPIKERLPVRALQVEQSNSSVIYGDRLFMKIFRRQEEGINPEIELGEFLTDVVAFRQVPPLAGHIEYWDSAGKSSAVAVFQGFVHGESDAWSYTLEAVRRYFDRVATATKNEAPNESLLPKRGFVFLTQGAIPPEAWSLCDTYLEAAALLGQRTAELHLALGSAVERPDFAPEPFSELYQRSLYQEMRGLTRRTFRLLRSRYHNLNEEDRLDVTTLLMLEQELLDRFESVMDHKLSGAKIRCHGDYHLGQVFYTGKDFVIIDFEGEPMRHLSQRRLKRSPLRDVAGMIRSFDYASQSVLLTHLTGLIKREDVAAFRKWAEAWTLWSTIAFLGRYLETMRGSSLLPASAQEVQMLLDAFLLEKAVYEVGYELNHRPAWLRVPVQGILRILASSEATP